MKLPALLLLVLSTTALTLHAQISPIRITVEQVVGKSDSNAKTGQKAQSRSLKITLNNNSAESFDGLQVKYWFFGRDMKSHDTKEITAGERKSSLAPRGKEVIESETASGTYVEQHAQAQRGGGRAGQPGRGGRAGGVTKVQASGDKITGYAVRVMKDDKVLAEYYSEPSYKALVGKK